ncbi:MAG TPA: VaFE repeat-containing surface-anchored protein [Mogibacterium sp.]|nr:VaFE repeat-containing surface-anchored protein [Mogibacterium sp.]
MYKENSKAESLKEITKSGPRLICFILLLTIILTTGVFKMEEAYAASAKITSVKALNAGASTEHIGRISGLSGYSYCMDTGRVFPKKGATGTLTKIKPTSSANARNVAKLLYYYAHLQSDKYTKKGSDVRILRLAMHLAYHNGDKWTKWPHASVITQKESSAAHKIYRDAKAKAFPSDTNFEAYIYSPDNTKLSYQRLAAYNVIPIEPGEAELIKELSDDGIRDEEGNLCGSTQGFKFEFRKKNNSEIAYTAKTDESGSFTISGIEPGTYIVKEILTEEQHKIYESLTDNQEIEIVEGETAVIKWINRYRPRVGLTILKKVDDEGGVAGFRFKISGRLFNNRPLSEEKLIEEADPEVEYDTGIYILDEWKADKEDLDALNSAARDGKTGEYFVRLTNKLIPYVDEETEEENISEDMNPEKPEEEAEGLSSNDSQEQIIAIKVKVRLKPNSNQETSTEPERIVQNDEVCKIQISNFDFLGSAGNFEDEFVTADTGEKVYTDLEPGEYTVTEIMTDIQNKRYMKPESQTVILTDTNKEAVFIFENKAKRTPVMLKKEYPGLSPEGIDFRLTGRTDFGVELEFTKKTDENGIIDFGRLYAGNYRIEETGFDSSHMVNMYKSKESEYPSFDFRIRGDEKGTVWLGGPKGEGDAGTEEKSFLNEERPVIETELLDRKTGEQEVTLSKETVLYDIVSFRNLIPGEEYTLTGRLVDKERGKPMADNGKEILRTINFIPKTSDDSIEMDFKFDSTAIGSEAVVAYQELSRDGEVLAVHADIDNEKQTVTFKEVPGKSPPTGNNLSKMPFIGFVLSILSCFAVVAAKFRRR